MFFHSCGHGHRMQYQLYISAKASVGSLFPWALRMNLLYHNKNLRSTLEHDEQQKSTMVVFVYQLRQGNAQWICIAQNPLANHVRYLQCRNGTCHSLWNTWWRQVQEQNAEVNGNHHDQISQVTQTFLNFVIFLCSYHILLLIRSTKPASELLEAPTSIHEGANVSMIKSFDPVTLVGWGPGCED